MSDKAEKIEKPEKADNSTAQVKLLMSCMKNKNGDSIDWQGVAEDCNITGTDGKPSKGAASKRYSRLLKTHGIDPSTVSTKGGSGSAPGTPKTPRTKSTPKSKAKRGPDADEDEPAGSETESPTKKRKRGGQKKAEEAEEDVEDEDVDNAVDA